MTQLLLGQLLREVGAGETLRPDQINALESSLALVSHGINTPQERAEIGAYYLGQTRNSAAVTIMTRFLKPAQE